MLVCTEQVHISYVCTYLHNLNHLAYTASTCVHSGKLYIHTSIAIYRHNDANYVRGERVSYVAKLGTALITY